MTAPELPDRNIKLTLEFDGTAYHGWQVQPDRPTVQGTLAAAAQKALGEPELTVTGCSRTDAGVHARRYCANFTTRWTHPADNIKRMLNTRLPADIVVHAAEDVPADFSARFSAAGKEYRYTILTTPTSQPLKDRYTWHNSRRLDLAVMQAAAAHLVGTHDFTAMSGSNDSGRDPVCTLFSVTVDAAEDGVVIAVRGRSFLFRMVRIIAGTLVDAGGGSITPADVAAILAGRDRRRMRAAAPARGLTLWEVWYE
ncbi:MAG: tRNA pseudouridine(38-40) synthase TruA [Planctomycetota bacterium]